VAGVPFHAQRTDECGPAALAMLLGWSGLAVSTQELIDEVMLPAREGSTQPALVAAVRRRGRVAVPVRGSADVFAELAAGRPVLTLQDLGYGPLSRWHYSVLIGYDLGRDTVLLHTGTDPERSFGRAAFERTWSHADEWGLLALPPGELPVRADERGYLEAVAGLERAGDSAGAERAYLAGTTRWPASAGAWLGLGNARYAQGDLGGAVRAFRSATELHTDNAVAWNNLAQALHDQGLREPALRAIERAVELAGPHREEFEATERAIRAGTP
jgi:hypothetical protein